VIFHSCKKEAAPTLTTSAISNITGTTATSGGTITSEGSGTIIARGVCWSTGISPTITENKTTDGGGTGTFTSNITGLNGGTVYYVRAYATNSSGAGYGTALSFTTLGQAPLATSQSAINVTSTSATLRGIINANYLSTVVTFEYGTSTTYGQSATTTQSPVTGSTNINVSTTVIGLTLGTSYHFRIKAVNTLGTTYGADMIFTTVLAVGDFYNGGYIFYVDASNQHGLIAAPSDQSTGIKWNNGSFVVTNAAGFSTGTGQTNTNSIIAVQGEGNYAAKICDNLVLNGYDDWFLPSYGEVILMRKLYDLRIGNLKADYYWSSTEYSANSKYQALSVSPSDIVGTAIFYKDALINVRAVRAF
jgi:hypothetical protein